MSIVTLRIVWVPFSVLISTSLVTTDTILNVDAHPNVQREQGFKLSNGSDKNESGIEFFWFVMLRNALLCRFQIDIHVLTFNY